MTYRIAVGDGSEWVHERGARDETGDVVGYLFSADDRVQQRKQLEQQREQLEAFASVVSHDLRNPLSVATGNIELARKFAGEAEHDRLDRAHDALDYMDDLISDLLALAREGRTVEATTTTDLRGVVTQAWRTIGAPDGVALVVDDPLPWVECDQDRLRQALENLFRNAVEHGAEDAIPIDADDRPAGASSGDGDAPVGSETDPSLRVFVGSLPAGFYVADDGGGIDPPERDVVFDPGHSTDEEGTGFGLSIVERVAEAHGWGVSVTESQAGGARFEFAGVDLTTPEGTGVADPATNEGSVSDPGDVGSRSGSETPPSE